MRKALIYCRVSSDRQVKEGHGLDGQELRCRGYAQAHGYEVAAVFRDEGVSGGVVDREGMEAMLAFLDAHDGEFVVVIDDIKRLARDLMGHFALRKAIQSRGATLESPSHRFGEEPEDLFVESIMAATAELERNQNRKQVKNRMKARLEAGYWPFYPPPGYEYAKVAGHGKVIVPKEPEAGIIRQAFEGFACGKFETPADVRRFLEACKFDSRRGRARAREATYAELVKRLLTREVYAGFIHYPPWDVTRRKGQHRPLVSGETFDRVQERLREKPRAPTRPDLHRDFPLRGFVLCGECNRPYTGAWCKGKTKRYPYYRCYTMDCPARDKTIRAERLHADLEAILETLKPREALLQAIREQFLAEWQRRMLDVETVRRERHRKLEAIQKEIDGYLDTVGRCSSPTVMRRIEEQVEVLEAKKLRLGGEIERGREYDYETALDLVFNFLKDPLQMWRTGDLRQKRLVLRLVFDGPLVHDRNSGLATPSLSLPVAVGCVPELDALEVVDMVRTSWNTLEELVRGWAEAIRGLAGPENTAPAS